MSSINKKTAQIISKKFGTPIFILKEKKLLKRFNKISTELKNKYSNSYIAYSFKTNPTIEIINLLIKKGCYAEVVSEFEYKIALKLNINPKKIIFNGPIKTNKILKQAIKNKSLINVDNMSELYRVNSIAIKLQEKVDIGIRLTEKGNNDVWDRFGFSMTNSSAKDAVQWIKKSSNLNLVGIHSHIGTNIRNLERFKYLGTNLSQFIELLYLKYNIKLKWIDVGGGVAGKNAKWEENVLKHKYPDIKTYVNLMVNPILETIQKYNLKPKLFFETGRTLVEDSTFLLTKIVGIRNDDNGDKAYIINGGLNQITTAKTYQHPIKCFKISNQKYKSSFYGPLCMQQDIIAKNRNLPILKINNLVLIKNVGAYNVSRSVPFIHPRAGMVLLKKNKIKLIKKHESIKSYLKFEKLS